MTLSLPRPHPVETAAPALVAVGLVRGSAALLRTVLSAGRLPEPIALEPPALSRPAAD